MTTRRHRLRRNRRGSSCWSPRAPRFKVIFDELEGELPLPTRMLLATSDFLARQLS
jgi:hypothetical protein